MRYFLAIYVLVIAAAVAVLGFRGQTSEKPPLRIFPDMDEQARYKPQAYTGYFSDGRQDRPPVAGTVEMMPEHLKVHAKYETFIEDDFLATGKNENGEFGRGYPFELTEDILDLGRQKYDIFCSRCHSDTGDGNGITKRFGMVTTPSYHDDRMRDMPEGQIYEAISNGKGLMGAYGSKLRVKERWAVVAYVRALQRARNGKVSDIPQQYRNELGL